MPNQEASATLRAVFTFYSDIVTVSAEGDSVLNDDTLQSIGTTFKSLILALFGSIIRIASPLDQDHDRTPEPSPSVTTPDLLVNSGELPQQPSPKEHPSSTSQLNGGYHEAAMEAVGTQQHAAFKAAAHATQGATSSSTYTESHKSSTRGTDVESELSEEAIGEESLLIKYLPDPGYFVAGAVAGGISRTATAPLDRLKVYLLVNTKSTNHMAIDAAKNGRPVAAAKNAGRSFWLACNELYRNGGMRGFFAGKYECYKTSA